MKTSICHYSLHRIFKKENWTLKQLVDYVKNQGVDAIDFHIRFLTSPATAADEIRTALEGSGLALSGLSLSTNFNQDDDSAFAKEIADAKEWIDVASELKVPASRIFGGSMADRSNPNVVKAGMERVKKAMHEIVPYAEGKGVVLALENHGGLPCSGEEQVEIIEDINSPNLQATVDIGNYMGMPQKPEDGTALAVRYCCYVHVKDLRILEGGKMERATLGEGEVDVPKCLKIIKDSGYQGYVALEYEGTEDELTGVPKSVAYMKKVLAEL